MTPSRTELLRIIAEISDAHPDLRLGQLITNLAMKGRNGHEDAVWNCEDDEFLPAARRMLDFYKKREPLETVAR
jgi:hypothetical protein